jgi:hypothetical protein
VSTFYGRAAVESDTRCFSSKQLTRNAVDDLFAGSDYGKLPFYFIVVDSIWICARRRTGEMLMNPEHNPRTSGIGEKNNLPGKRLLFFRENTACGNPTPAHLP